MGKAAHTLVSTTGNFGAMRASAAARRLETQCRTGSHQDNAGLVGDLRQACAESALAMQLWMTGRQPRSSLAS
jgi:HPt (histidine-containing phosphotransfer) domain-containing protein